MDIKEQIMNTAEEWVHNKIDTYFANMSQNRFTDVLVGQTKKVAGNVLSKMEHKLDDVLFYITDKDGNINVATMDDAMLKDAFMEMPRRGFKYGEFGKGTIDFRIPDNLITDLFFGDDKIVSIGWDDIKELKDMLTEVKPIN